MTDNPKLAAFARMGSRPIPRVVRMMTVAASAGYECIFLAARRDEDLAIEDTWEGWRILRLGRPFPLLNGTRPFLYAGSVLRYNWDLFKTLNRMKPGLVHASDCETMPAAILYKWRSRARLIYNIHDNLAQRYRVPSFVAKAMNAVEGLFVLCSSSAVVPEGFRREALPNWCKRKVAVVRNTPIDQGFSPPEFPADKHVRIFLGGWLDWGRGLRALIELAETNPRVELRIAGEGSPAIVTELKSNSRLVYLGFLDHNRVLEETRRSHFVSALYDPDRIINRFAASNKLAEALSVGRPVILNTEMEIAKDFHSDPCVVALPYTQAATGGSRLIELYDDRTAYLDACSRARAAYDGRYSWNIVRKQSWEVMFPGSALPSIAAPDIQAQVGQTPVL
jgi:glycosyltransferase involved in cell wall biosynthesis